MNAGTEDPGWGPALRPVWQLLIPWIPLLIRRRRVDLVGLRRVFIHVGLTLTEAAIVIAATFEGPSHGAIWGWAFLGLGTPLAVGGLIWSTKTQRRVPPDSIESIADGSRALFFIRLGFAASPALYGIVGTELTRTPSFAFIGTAISLVLLALYGPTRSRVDTLEERLRLSGSRISLRAALDATAVGPGSPGASLG